MAEAVPSGAQGRRTPKAGRPFAEPRARSQEYEALVRFLRQRKAESGLTLSQLADTAALRKADLKKSAIGERLAGDKLSAEFVTAFVLACTEAKELLPRRGRLLDKGAELLRAAQARHTPVVDLSRLPASTRNAALDAQDLALALQVLPLDAPSHAGLGGPFTILETPEHHHLVYAESQLGNHWIADPDQAANVSLKYAMLRSQALSPQDSQSLLDRLLGEQ